MGDLSLSALRMRYILSAASTPLSESTSCWRRCPLFWVVTKTSPPRREKWSHGTPPAETYLTAARHNPNHFRYLSCGDRQSFASALSSGSDSSPASFFFLHLLIRLK